MSNHILLEEIDDYLSPSQACVNPVFTSSKSPLSTTTTTVPSSSSAALSSTPGGLVTTKRRRGRGSRLSSPAIEEEGDSSIPTKKQGTQTDPVKASIADCLACSGCVTTAETVLIEEQHSLRLLESLIATKQQRIVVTISPASWADLSRYLNIHPDSVKTFRRQFASLLCHYLSMNAVLDGNVPLIWSLQEAALEFCRAYEQQQQQQSTKQCCTNTSMDVENNEADDLDESLIPSLAISSTETQFITKQGLVVNVKHTSHQRFRQQLPLISSSCPAVVCLVEKSIRGAVSHLATTKSPMAFAGSMWKTLDSQVFHLAIMPCHDKKLEASRKDFKNSIGQKDVDMVITTSECLDLLAQAIRRQCKTIKDLAVNGHFGSDENVMLIQQELSKAVPATVQSHFDTLIPLNTLLISAESEQVPVVNNNPHSSDFFTLGSGGYADYIFRFAARYLFGVSLVQTPWEPVVVSTVANVSARVAQKRRGYYQACLYQPGLNGEYSCRPTQPNEQPVLKFVLAYGMQTLQRVMQPFRDSVTADFHYMEAMACPSGCLNGNGQLRVVARETPTEARHRLMATQARLAVPTVTPESAIMPVEADQRHTRYHVVPPMLHQSGATAGMAVDKMQW